MWQGYKLSTANIFSFGFEKNDVDGFFDLNMFKIFPYNALFMNMNMNPNTMMM